MSKCSFILGDNGRLDKFTRQARDRCIREVIEPMARDGLRTISVAYRDFVLGKAEINQVIMQNCLGKSRINRAKMSPTNLGYPVISPNWTFCGPGYQSRSL